MKRVLWLGVGAVAGFVIAREVARWQRWGTEFRRPSIPLSRLRQAMVEAIGGMEQARMMGAYVYANGQPIGRVTGLESGVLTYEREA